jgi:flagellar hook-associated protein 1 FlgK
MPDVNIMGGLNTALLNAMSGLNASQGALDATSNNIANVNTPGYTREEALLSESPETQTGEEISGGGVQLLGLQSIRDELLNLQINQQTSLQGAANTESSSLDQVQTLFNPTGTDIASALSDFSSSLVELSGNSTSTSAQQAVLSAGQGLATAFNTTASGLTSAQTAATQQVPDTVSQINSLTAQIAQLNGQLTQVPAAEDGGTTQDQLDQAVQQLSGLTNISVTQTNNGETITTGSGTPLVEGNQSYNLQSAPGANGQAVVEDSNGNNITSSITGGTLGGSLTIANQTIPGILTQLNTLASQFATEFNSAQSGGTDSNGNAGAAFFSGTTNLNSAAADISVALTSPSQIAVNSDGSTGGSGNVANLSAALTNDLPSGQSAAGGFASILFNVGTAASNASTQSTAIGDNLTQLTALQGSVSAVNIDEETTNLLRYQTAYEAASRVVSTVQVLDNAALDMGSSTSF